MKQTGEGILAQSEIFFSSPSQKARELYYHALCAGHFYCDENYNLERDGYDSFLILHVIDGSITYEKCEGESVTAEKNETVIIDCYKMHRYYATGHLESVWVHVAGANSKELCGEIIQKSGNVIKAKDNSVKDKLFSLLDALSGKRPASEAKMSVDIYELLLTFMEGGDEQDKLLHVDDIMLVKSYIFAHLDEKLTVAFLADMAHMSPTHFSRLFKLQMGFSPYDYVLTARLNKAKELLHKSNKTVAEIAYETGFNSQANFVYSFTKNEGISPGKFRKIRF